jgi:uncharacterized protein (TIGR02300 family)
MSKPARGTKRVCPSCGARFYDLSRTPITCPVCQAVYQVTPPTSRRAERAQPVEVKKVVEPPADVPVLKSADIISLEEAEETGAEVPVEEDEEIVDLGDDTPEIPAGDDDNAFLEEEEEEGGTDVTGIVGTPGEET